MEIDKFVYFNKLYSTYKEVLTKKQKEVLELYLEEDFSLGEISEELSISRQAVHDSVKRSEQVLNDFEQKLGILKRERQIRSQVEEIRKVIDAEDSKIDKSIREKIANVCKELIE